MSSAIAGDIFTEMLTENTGRALCDSGDMYGRRYDLNAHRDFEAEDAAHLHIDASGIEFSTNTYHYLKEHLTLSDWLQEKLEEFSEREDMQDESWLGIMESFGPYLRDEGYEVTGLYGDGDPMVINTYNHESLLDQTLQYVYMEVNQEGYVLLQVHGGCDVRGGYTRPRAFKIDDYDSASFLCDQDGTIQCENDHDHYWRTDDGYHWYAEGACGRGAGTQLEDYDREEIEDVEEGLPAAVAAKLQDEEKLFFTSEGKAFCPICGGQLSASMY